MAVGRLSEAEVAAQLRDHDVDLVVLHQGIDTTTSTGHRVTSCEVRNSHAVASSDAAALESGLPRGTVGPTARFGSLGSGLSWATSIDGVGAR